MSDWFNRICDTTVIENRLFKHLYDVWSWLCFAHGCLPSVDELKSHLSDDIIDKSVTVLYGPADDRFHYRNPGKDIWLINGLKATETDSTLFDTFCQSLRIDTQWRRMIIGRYPVLIQNSLLDPFIFQSLAYGKVGGKADGKADGKSGNTDTTSALSPCLHRPSQQMEESNYVCSGIAVPLARYGLTIADHLLFVFEIKISGIVADKNQPSHSGTGTAKS